MPEKKRFLIYFLFNFSLSLLFFGGNSFIRVEFFFLGHVIIAGDLTSRQLSTSVVYMAHRFSVDESSSASFFERVRCALIIIIIFFFALLCLCSFILFVQFLRICL